MPQPVMNVVLSIIITSYRNPGLLELCLRSLKTNIRDIPFELIVCDSATQEPTYDLMRLSYPEVSFRPNKKNIGFGKLVNEGLSVAKSEFVFVMNADIIVKDAAAITILMDYLRNNPKVGIVGPQLINFDNTVQPSFFRFYTPFTILYRRTFLQRYAFAKQHLDRFLMKDVAQPTAPLVVDWIMGSAMMLHREALDQVGFMDTHRFFMYFEDVDWCWRFWQARFQVVYHPGAKVYHYHGKQSASRSAFWAVLRNQYTRIHIVSAIRFFWKYRKVPNPHCEYDKRIEEPVGF